MLGSGRIWFDLSFESTSEIRTSSILVCLGLHDHHILTCWMRYPSPEIFKFLLALKLRVFIIPWWRWPLPKEFEALCESAFLTDLKKHFKQNKTTNKQVPSFRWKWLRLVSQVLYISHQTYYYKKKFTIILESRDLDPTAHFVISWESLLFSLDFTFLNCKMRIAIPCLFTM